MTFSEALEHLKNHHVVTRKGWNGKSMFVLLVKGQGVEEACILGKEVELKNSDYIQMKTADNCLVPWIASQTDLLANDWELFYDE